MVSPPPSAPTFAWLTPPGRTALSLLRCSAVPALLDCPLPDPGRIRLARLVAPDGGAVDEVLAVRLSEDALELDLHGGEGVRRAVEGCLRAHGFRTHASDDIPGDPRWWALAGAVHPAAVRWLLAHPGAEPPFAGLLERQPLVLITGPANAGKSTLLNRLCGRTRALVGAEPGTTRDLVAAEALVGGWRLRLVDSAGLRPAAADGIERAGQELAMAARARADLVLYLWAPGDGGPGPRAGDLLVRGKADLHGEAGIRWSDRAADGDAALAAVQAAILARLGLPQG